MDRIQSISKPHGAAVQYFAADQGDFIDWRSNIPFVFARIKHTGRAFRAVDRRTRDQTDLIYKAGTQTFAICITASFDQQSLDPEFPIQDFEGQRQIDGISTGEEIGDSILAQPGQMRIRDLLREHDDYRISTNIRTAPRDFSVRVQHHPISLCIALEKARLASHLDR